MYCGRLAVVFTSVQQRRVLKEFYFLGFFPDQNRVNSLWILRARLISPAGNLLIKFWLTFFARPCGRNVVSDRYTIVGVFLIQRRRARVSSNFSGWVATASMTRHSSFVRQQGDLQGPPKNVNTAVGLCCQCLNIVSQSKEHRARRQEARRVRSCPGKRPCPLPFFDHSPRDYIRRVIAVTLVVFLYVFFFF